MNHDRPTTEEQIADSIERLVETSDRIAVALERIADAMDRAYPKDIAVSVSDWQCAGCHRYQPNGQEKCVECGTPRVREPRR